MCNYRGYVPEHARFRPFKTKLNINTVTSTFSDTVAVDNAAENI
jgi:hypothetical protein